MTCNRCGIYSDKHEGGLCFACWLIERSNDPPPDENDDTQIVEAEEDCSQ